MPFKVRTKRPRSGEASRPARIALALIGVVALVAAVAAAAAISWWDQNQSRVFSMADAGKAFGSSTDNAGCLQEAISRSQKATTVVDTALVPIFLEHCLNNSTPSPGFCNGVPPAGAFAKSAKWAGEQARQHRVRDANIFVTAQVYCSTLGSGAR